MTRAGLPARDLWQGAIAVAVVVAAVRAVLLGVRDGYAASGLEGMASRSVARDFLAGVVPCIAVALASWAALRRWRGSRVGVAVVVVAAAVLAAAFVAGRLPPVPMRGPGFRGLQEPLLPGVAASAAIVVAAGALLGPRLPAALLRAAAGAALALVVGAAGLLGASLLAQAPPIARSATTPAPNVIPRRSHGR